jgi:translation initiation factor IF-2
MRVYELAKQLNLSNKEIIALLAQKGVVVKSHMAALSDDVIQLVQRDFKKTATTAVMQPERQKVEKSAPRAEQQISPVHVAGIAEPVRPKPETKVFKPELSSLSQDSQEVSQEFIVMPMTVGDVAERMHKPVSDVILTLLKQRILGAKNQILTAKIVEQLAKHYGYTVKYPVEAAKSEVSRVAAVSTGQHLRLPVIVVLGHVDHGKTSLLDFIRKTKVAAKEKGGITQHLGAYEAKTPQGNLIFLDTPGHAAFSNIRGRGVSVADIAVLVIAADDGIMPQTIEAIRKIKEAQIPVIVAINKVDKVEQKQIEIVKRDLARYDLVTEEWGGQTVCVPISAKTGLGIDNLLEMLVLQSQLMDLKADLAVPARGFILESRLEKGRGAVATVICQNGTLRVGDFFIAGHMVGKVSSLTDSFGKRLTEVGPSVPVQVAGFSELAKAGDSFEVISADKYKEVKALKTPQAMADLVKNLAQGESINVIIKTDTSSSLEALLNAINTISEKADKKIQIITSGIGDISESDVTLATDTGSDIIGLHVKIEPNAQAIAQKNLVSIRIFEVIYHLLEDLELRTKEPEKPKLITKKIGEALVRKVFDIKNVGIIAGCYCREGRFTRDGKVTIWRGKKKVGEGKIKGLERDRKSVKEVHAGFEFAFLADGFNEWQIDDRVECYAEVPAL